MIRSGLVVLVAVAACGESPGEIVPGVDAPCEAGTLGAEAGFVEIEHPSGASRIFYSFQPADACQLSRPLAVIFNGGPGASSAPLITLNTGPFALAPIELDPPFGIEPIPGPVSLIRNPHSWTRFANLLYIDAARAGFSYDVTTRRQLDGSRDADLFVRVVLRFLAAHPAMRASPVVIVGESYGGARATLMLDRLLRYRERATGELADEIQQHYDAVFGAAGALVPPEVIRGQFGHQVLIQPLVLPSQVIGGCSGGNDDTSKPPGWLVRLAATIERACSYASTLEVLWGVDPRSLPELLPPGRARAARDPSEVEPAGDLAATLGALPAGDAYFRLLGGRFEIDRAALGERFLENLVHVETLVTNARYDCNIVSRDIPERMRASSAIETLEVEADRFEIVYRDPAIGARTVLFPSYDAGHMVSATAPAALAADIATLLAP